MKILIDITHPAHVHFFRNAITAFERRGHQIRIVSRVKDMTVELLDALDVPHQPLSTAPRTKSLLAFLKEMLIHCWRLFWIARKFRPDVMLQVAGTFIAPVGWLLRRPRVAFYDTEFARISNTLSYPLLTAVCTPECYEGSAGPRHVRYPGYHELAYLHPDVFSPDPAVIAELGLGSEEKFSIVRFVGFSALHDYGEEGFNLPYKRRLVEELARYGRVFISSEAPLPPDLQPFALQIPIEKIHHLLAFAAVLVGESATMASEASVLGVPSIFISTHFRGYTVEQESRYGLVWNLKPEAQGKCLSLVSSLLSRPLEDIRREYRKKLGRLLDERISTTDWVVEYVETQFS